MVGFSFSLNDCLRDSVVSDFEPPGEHAYHTKAGNEKQPRYRRFSLAFMIEFCDIFIMLHLIFKRHQFYEKAGVKDK